MISKYFTVAYLFGPYGIEMSKSEKAFSFAGLALLAISLIVYLTKRASKNILYKKIAAKWWNLTFWIGLLSTIWATLRYEAIEYLSANVIVVAVYLAGIVWLVSLLVYQFSTYKRLQATHEKEAQKKKYM